MQDFAMGFCKDFCCNFFWQFKLIKGNKVPTLKRRPVMMNPSPGRSKSLPNAKGETFNLDVWTPKLDISIIINLFGLLWSIILTHTTSKSHSKSYEIVSLCVKFIVGGFSNTYLRLFGLCEKTHKTWNCFTPILGLFKREIHAHSDEFFDGGFSNDIVIQLSSWQ